MGTWEIVWAATSILANTENVGTFIKSPLLIFQNSVWFWVALLIFFFWILALVWTIKDSNARSYSFWFVFLSALCVILLTPILGIPLYVAIRPQWWKWDKVSWRNNQFLHIQSCENCGNDNLIENKCCTFCGERLTTVCRECQKEYSKSYDYCPECGAPRLEI